MGGSSWTATKHSTPNRCVILLCQYSQFPLTLLPFLRLGGSKCDPHGFILGEVIIFLGRVEPLPNPPPSISTLGGDIAHLLFPLLSSFILPSIRFPFPIKPRKGPPLFLTEGHTSMTKSGLVCVYCLVVWLSWAVSSCVFFCVVWFCLSVRYSQVIGWKDLLSWYISYQIEDLFIVMF